MPFAFTVFDVQSHAGECLPYVTLFRTAHYRSLISLEITQQTEGMMEREHVLKILNALANRIYTQ